MTEYIERDAAVKIAEKYGICNGNVLGRHSGVADCIASEIARLPAANVAPIWWAIDSTSSGEFDSCRNPVSISFGCSLALADSSETVQSDGNIPQLVVRTKYAGDVYTALVELGWEPDTAAAFLEKIPDANGGLERPCREGQSILYCDDEPFVYADPEGDDDNETD